jgi:hypothetical protein
MAKRSAKRSARDAESSPSPIPNFQGREAIRHPLPGGNGSGADADAATPEPTGLALWLQTGSRQIWLGIAALLLVTLLQFGSVLITSAHPVLGSIDADGNAAEGPARAFITRSFHSGVFPLWNPHLFSGQPFFGAGEAPLLYPPTWLHCVLRLDKAINAILAMHVFLIGLGMYLWALQQKMRPASAFIAATVVMFGGPFYLHVFACHIENISAMAWVPFLFLAMDLIFVRLYWEGLLVGAFSFGMEILAGQPQYLFYAVIAMAIYAIIRLVRAVEWPRKLGLLVAAATVGVGFTAFQLMLVLPQVQESIRRSGGVTREFAAMFSFPPENIATLLAPGIFGNEVDLRYWGRCYMWEMSLFMGVSGFLLALYGILAPSLPRTVPATAVGKDASGSPFPVGERGWGRGVQAGSRKWIWGAMALLLFVLALGAHTPLFDFLYSYVPGFNKFRGLSKFAFDGSIFVALLSAAGFDALTVGLADRGRCSGSACRRTVAVVAFALAVAALVFGMSIRPTNGQASDAWKANLTALLSSPEIDTLHTNAMSAPSFAARSASFAAKQLLIAAALLAVGGGLFLAAKRPWARYALFAMVCAEMCIFAHHYRAAVDLSTIVSPQAVAFVNDHPGDYRVLNLDWADEAMATGARDIWGYDSFKLQRYAEFVAYSQGLPLTYDNLMSPNITHSGPFFRLLRVRYILQPSATGTQAVPLNMDLPHILLVNRYLVLQGRDNILASLADKSFDPTSQIILETPPVPPPVDSGDPGTVHLRHEDANSLTIDASLTHAAILLITDSYSRGWRAVALPGSVQSSYSLLPADYTLRAIPLSAGVHHIRVEFEPAGMVAGIVISTAFLALYILLLGRYVWIRMKRT